MKMISICEEVKNNGRSDVKTYNNKFYLLLELLELNKINLKTAIKKVSENKSLVLAKVEKNSDGLEIIKIANSEDLKKLSL